jgi:hypothetical protein
MGDSAIVFLGYDRDEHRRTISALTRSPQRYDLHMGMVSNAVDKLPRWAKATLLSVAAVGCVYLIATMGLDNFLLHLIFSPWLS